MTTFSSFIAGQRPCKGTSYTREKGKENFLYSCAMAENIMSSANIQLFKATLCMDLLKLKCHLIFRAIQCLEKQFL